MKKTIALLLAAALLSVGLVVSCGGGDDPEPEPAPAGTTQYTVSFDTDGGTPATIASVKVNAGSAVGSAKWPDDPAKGSENKFDGWFEGAVEYKADTKINKDVTLKAKYSLRPARDLGGITWPNTLTQQGWRVTNTDNTETDLSMVELTNAKYIVLHTKGGDSDTVISKDLKVALQSNVTWKWNSTTVSAADIAIDRTKDTFIVIEISKLTGGGEFSDDTCNQAKFLIDYNKSNSILGLGLEAGYLYYQGLTAPAGKSSELKNKVKIEGVDTDVVYGFATNENIIGITIPTAFKTVSFNTNGGNSIADIKVGTGKSMGVKYPTWAARDALAGNIYDFDGWFEGRTEYTASTPIAADVTLAASWAPTKLPVFKTGANMDFLGKYTTGNAIGFGGVDGSLAKSLFNDGKYLVLLFQGSNRSSTAFGGVQIVIQGVGNGYAWHMNESAGDTAIAIGDKEFAFVVVDIAQLKDYTDCKDNDGGAKFVLNYGFGGYKCAWMTTEDLDLTTFIAHNQAPGGENASQAFYLTKVLGIEK